MRTLPSSQLKKSKLTDVFLFLPFLCPLVEHSLDYSTHAGSKRQEQINNASFIVAEIPGTVERNPRPYLRHMGLVFITLYQTNVARR